MSTIDNLNNSINKILYHVPGSTHSNCSGSYRIFIFVIICICIYLFVIRMISGQNNISNVDIMNKNIGSIPYFGPISFWPISHFILFMVLGILFPDCDALIITAGIIWEIIECVYGAYIESPLSRSVFGKESQVKYTSHPKNQSNIQYEKWWSGSVADIAFDIAGFYFGKLLSKIFNIHIKIPYINDDKVKINNN